MYFVTATGHVGQRTDPTEPSAARQLVKTRDEQLAEQAIQIESLREQDQVQAAAFRAAQTRLPTTIRAIAGTSDNGPNGKNQSASARDRSDRRRVANSEGEEPENLRTVPRGRLRSVETAKVAPEEPPESRKAHRWT